MALVIPRQYADGQILFKAQLDAAFDSIETQLNDTKLNDENIQVGGISADNLAANSVTTAKIAAAAVTLAKLATDITERLNPTGTVLSYAGAAAPSGYLICDGSQVSRIVYAALFNVIGESFGEGDNTTTFHLPDMRGRFFRGQDDGAGRDPDAATRTAMNTGGNTGDAVGSIQTQEVQTLKIRVTASIANGDLNTATNFAYRDATNTGLGQSTLGSLVASNSFISTGGTDSETRPINVNINYIIKT